MKYDILYKSILFYWWLVVLLCLYELMRPIADAFREGDVIFASVVGLTAILLFLWLNVIKDIYFVLKATQKQRLYRQPAAYKQGKPLVELILYVKNDFQWQVFQHVAQLRYRPYRVVILDDSTDRVWKRRINYHARKHGAIIIRRNDRKGGKAEAINSYLATSTADFFILLDTNGFVRKNFIQKALPYFNNPKVGVVQASHISAKDAFDIMAHVEYGTIAHANLYQMVKNTFGFLPVAGHGVMIRKKAFDATEGFSYLGSEDIRFSVDLRNNGYWARFVPALSYFTGSIDQAEGDFTSCRWTVFNWFSLFFNAKKIFQSKMQWFEKLDAYLFLHQLPFSFVLRSYIVLIVVMQATVNFALQYSFEMQFPLFLLITMPVVPYMAYEGRTNREVYKKAYSTWVKKARRSHKRFVVAFNQVIADLPLVINVKIYQRLAVRS